MCDRPKPYSLPVAFPAQQKKEQESGRSSPKWTMDKPDSPLLDEFVRLWELIDEAHFDGNNSDEDAIIWTRTTSGEYSAKSTYDMQFEGGSFEMVWKVWAPSRCKFFMWIMLQKRVWIANWLLSREWLNCYFYQLCWRNLKTALHLFTECPASRTIWSCISTWRSWPAMNPTNWSVLDDLAAWFFDFAGS